jgi:predicted TIM-barrel fold metal-dependent hydrolase
MNKLSSEQFTRIVHNHGADRILFATDSPWGGQSETADWIRGMELTEEELERIFWRNGAELLGCQIIPNKTWSVDKLNSGLHE